MEDLRQRITDMGTSAALLGAWVVVASALSILLNASDGVDGDGPAIIRVALGLFGLAAGALFWTGRDFGKPGLQAIMVWGVLQIPVYAWRPDGNPTKQLFDLVLGTSNQTVVNGVVTNFSQIGINLVGVAVVIWAYRRRERLDLWRRRSLAPADRSPVHATADVLRSEQAHVSARKTPSPRRWSLVPRDDNRRRKT